MNRELIERLAREAGMQVDHAMQMDLTDGTSKMVGAVEMLRAPVDQLARFAALVAEECAKVIDSDSYPHARAIRAKFPKPLT